MIRTAEDFRAARARLGMTGAALEKALRLSDCGGRTVRRYESGKATIPGPVTLALEALVERKEAKNHD